MAPKTQSVTLRIPSSLLAQIDAAALQHQRTRTEEIISRLQPKIDPCPHCNSPLIPWGAFKRCQACQRNF